MLNTVSVTAHNPSSKWFIAGVVIAMLGWTAIVLTLFLGLRFDVGKGFMGVLAIGPVAIILGSILAWHKLQDTSNPTRRLCRWFLVFFFIAFVIGGSFLASDLFDEKDSAPQDTPQDDDDDNEKWGALVGLVFLYFFIPVTVCLLIYSITACCISSNCQPPVDYVQVHQVVVQDPPQEGTALNSTNQQNFYTAKSVP